MTTDKLIWLVQLKFKPKPKSKNYHTANKYRNW